MHIRLGDREQYIGDSFSGYFRFLEAFMDSVADIVQDMGQPRPMFHVFSETAKPCPNAKTGLFEEFPKWPVVMNQVWPTRSRATVEREYFFRRALICKSGKNKFQIKTSSMTYVHASPRMYSAQFRMTVLFERGNICLAAL